VKAIAWIYVGNSRGEGRVDITRPDVRLRMVQEAVWLTTVCGFDGVQPLAGGGSIKALDRLDIIELLCYNTIGDSTGEAC
jgi:hypothetical protein